MTEVIDTTANPSLSKWHPMLRGFTSAERRAGRHLRDGEGHPADPPASGAPADPAPADPPSDPPADPDEGTVLGGEPAPPAEPSADPDPATLPPEKYELTPPDGLALDEETLSEADPVFRELGLSNDAAQKLIPVAAKFGERIAAQATTALQAQQAEGFATLKKEWATTAKSDPEIGGSNWDRTVELSAKALDALGYPKGSEFRNYLTETGLGNHPEMIRTMRKVGEMVGEDGDFVRGDTGAAVNLPREAILYPDDVPKQGAN